jgi:hypothetical protein
MADATKSERRLSFAIELFALNFHSFTYLVLPFSNDKVATGQTRLNDNTLVQNVARGHSLPMGRAVFH